MHVFGSALRRSSTCDNAHIVFRGSIKALLNAHSSCIKAHSVFSGPLKALLMLIQAVLRRCEGIIGVQVLVYVATSIAASVVQLALCFSSG